MENIRKRVDVTLLNDKKRAEKLSAKPNFLRGSSGNSYEKDEASFQQARLSRHVHFGFKQNVDVRFSL